MEAINWVWPQDIPPTAKFVLLALADKANDERACWPKISTLVEMTGLGRSAVLKAISDLKVAGRIEVTAGRGNLSTYTIKIDNREVHEQDVQKSSKTTTEVQQADTRSPVKRPQKSTSRTSLYKNPHRTLNEPKEDPTHAREAFDSFWQAYPRKRGKANAAKAWAKLKPDDVLVEVIMAAVALWRQSPDWRKNGGTFIPHPTTWLNGKRWEDSPVIEITPEQPKEGRTAMQLRAVHEMMRGSNGADTGVVRDGDSDRNVPPLRSPPQLLTE